MRSRWRFMTPVVALGVVLAACSGNNAASQPAGSGGAASLQGQKVTVIGTWSGDEQTAFLKMVQPWEAQTGAKVAYTGTRDINTILTTGVASGVLPDLAGLPGPGQMAEYAQQGALQPLDGVLDLNTYTSETSPGLVKLGQVSGKTYGVFIKAAIKGLIWYSPKLHDYSSSPPATWSDLLSQGKTNQGAAKSLWCLGIESGAASGWPATDIVEELVLHSAGPDVYTSWYNGKTKWSDPAIKQAFTTYYNDIVQNAYGGGTTAVSTNFANAGDPLFKSPPGCEFFDQASFITGLGAFKDKKAGTDYNFFPFPSINDQYKTAVEGAGDLFGMFHATDAAKSLMKYLVTAPAQDIWVKIGGALSANKNATDYPDDISKRSAALLAQAQSFVFDASDNMPADMNAAFWTAMVDLTRGKKTVDQVLTDLDKVQATAYQTS
jgi:alpha-glucoside transport system substrate-binding protein